MSFEANVGDILIAAYETPYAVTNDKALMTLNADDGDGDIHVEVVARYSRGEIETSYCVSDDYFRKATPGEITGWINKGDVDNLRFGCDFIFAAARELSFTLYKDTFNNVVFGIVGTKFLAVIASANSAYIGKGYRDEAASLTPISANEASVLASCVYSLEGIEDIISSARTDNNCPTETEHQTPIMDSTKEFAFSVKEIEALKADEVRLLDEFGYGHTDVGLDAWNRTWMQNKGWLVYWMSKHPNYVPGKFMIAYQSDYTREFDKNGVDTFVDWAQKSLRFLRKPVEKMESPWTFDELEDIIDKIEYVTRYCDYLEHMTGQPVTVGNRKSDEYRADLTFFNEFKKELDEKYIRSGRAIYLRADIDREKIINSWFTLFENVIRKATLDQDAADALNKKAEEAGIRLRAAAGQKITKVAQKMCQACGLDQIKDMRTDAVTGRVRDFGFNKQIAMLGDAVNPLTMHRYTVLSANPIDYLTMSFGNSWASCHTIDKNNQRGTQKNGNHTYQGCYSSGTLSYMLDGASLIYYQVDGTKGNENLSFEDKMCREVFCLGHEKMIQSRLYPFGRDNEGKDDTKSMQAQVRAQVETIVADMFGTNNLWRIKKGSSACGAVTTSHGTHYRDYTGYNDGVVCTLRDGCASEIEKRIDIGHDPICPICGNEHTDEEWITCGGDFDSCNEGSDIIGYCDHCGAAIHDNDNYIRDEDTGNLYCDCDCAAEEDVFWCDNVDEYHSEDIYCDVDNEYFYDPDEEHVETPDGYIYRTANDAREAGLEFAEDTEQWLPVEELYHCDHCDRWITEAAWDSDHDCCNDCAEREEAI